MKKERISDAVIRRLPRYYRHLTNMYKRGVFHVSSQSLGEEMNITASQIRQDFSCFGEFGKRGYGYDVKKLNVEISKILGVDKQRNIAIIGVGNLGRALLENFPFVPNGFSVEAAFDISQSIIGKAINGVEVYSMDKLNDYIVTNALDAVILTIPQSIAQETVTQLINLGIQNFWNFTNLELTTSNPNVIIENIHFADSLQMLSYRITTR